MRTGVLEKIRTLEADLEACRTGVVQQMLLKISNARHQILRDHFCLQQAQAANSIAQKLLDVYLDEDDVEMARNEPTEEGDVVDAIRDFDAKVAELREYHKRYPNAEPIVRKHATPDPALLDNIFNLQEYYGAYLDLQPHYNAYQQFVIESRLRAANGNTAESESLHFAAPIEFYKFTESLPSLLLTQIPCKQKLVCFDEYASFTDGLVTYLSDFHRRIRPLDQSAFHADMSSAEKGYAEFRQVMEKHNLAPQHLKRFEKNFAVWDYAKAKNEHKRSAEEINKVAIQEAQIVAVLSLSLSAIFRATEKRSVRVGSKLTEELEQERKDHDRVFRESLAEAERSFAVAMFVDHVARAELTDADGAMQSANVMKNEENDDDDDGKEILGADGQPLPKWLVKQMQLKKKFVCEVCGGEVFRGMKTYHEHFTLERHCEGLRQLGVPRELMFYFVGINGMSDVLRFRDLFSQHLEKLSLRKRIRDEADEEEIQDIQGNVMTARSFSAFQGSRRHAL